MGEQVIEPQQVVEPTQEQVNADLGFGSQPAPSPAPRQPEAPDQAKLIEEAIQRALNPINAQLGKFRQVQSEWDKQKQQTTQYQPPASWAELTPEQKKQSQEIVKAAWREEFGKEWDDTQSMRNEFATARQQQTIMSDVQSLAGKDFGDLDNIMGDIYKNAKQAAENGDQSAADFLKELSETKAARFQLVEMARNIHRQNLEKTSQGAQATQEAGRKKVSTAVSRPGNASSSQTDLASVERIKDPKERLKVLQSMMDQQG